MADLPVAEQTLVGRVTGGHVDDLPFADVTTALGLGKYVAVGFNDAPTWIDPDADDWADVVANDYGWVQFSFNAYAGDAFALVAGTGDGNTNKVLFEAYATGVDAFLTNGDGSIGVTVATSGTSLTVSGNAGQTDPVLDLGPFIVAPDGKVGGVAPNTGDVLQWDGSKIVWVTP